MNLHLHSLRPLTLVAIAAGLAGPATITAHAQDAPTTAAHSAAASPAAASNRADTGAQRLIRIRAEADVLVQQRLITLRAHLTALGSADAKHLTAADRSRLTEEVQHDITGLTALDAKIQADTDVLTAHADALSIITAYRVYLLENPKLWLVRGADAQAAAEQGLSQVGAELTTLVNASKSSHRADAQAVLADFSAKLAAATQATALIDPAVLPLTPAGYPGNHPTLLAAVDNLQLAHADLGAARADVDRVLHDLKG